jgi:hypothetical protein
MYYIKLYSYVLNLYFVAVNIAFPMLDYNIIMA